MREIHTARSLFLIDDATQSFSVHFPPGTFKGAVRPAYGEPHLVSKGYTPEQEAAYRENAERVGCSDLFRMALQHDLAHQLAAEAMGWPTAMSLMLQALGSECRKCGTTVQRLTGQRQLDWEDEVAMAAQCIANGVSCARDGGMGAALIEYVAGQLDLLLEGMP